MSAKELRFDRLGERVYSRSADDPAWRPWSPTARCAAGATG